MDRDDSGDQEFKDQHGQVQIWTGCLPTIVPISITNYDISAIALGAGHVICLTKNGIVFTFGNGERGQLGNGKLDECVKPPQQLHCLSNKNVINVACGSRHSAAICNNGDLYMWGDNSSGQCAIEQDCASEPTKVTITQPAITCSYGVRHEEKIIKIVQIACGDSHTLALSDYYNVWTWGSGVQLGLMKSEKEVKPCRIDFLLNRRVLAISCGSQHSVAILEKLPRSGLVASEQKNIITHKFDVSTCAQCHQDYYTCLEVGDAVLINDVHVCPLGLPLIRNNSSDKLTIDEFKKRTVSEDVNDISHLIKESISGEILEKQEIEDDKTIIMAQIANLEEFKIENLSVNEQIKVDKLKISYELVEQKESSKSTINQECAISNPQNDQTYSETSHGGELAGSENNSIELKEIQKSLVNQEGVTNVCPSEKQTCSETLNEGEFAKNDNNCSSIVETDNVDTDVGSPKKRSCSFLNSSSTKEFLAKQLASLQDGSHVDKELVTDPTPNFDQSQTPVFQNKLLSGVKNTVDKFSFVSKGSLESPSSSQESLDSNELHSSEKKKTSSKVSSQASTLSQHSLEEIFCTMDHFSNHSFRKLSGSHVILDTEVWTWGKGDLGQLGHGDTLDRPQPCCIKMLSSKCVVKVAAGANHTLALTSDSQVYSWGSNTYGQLCHKESPNITPHLVKLVSGTLIWDVAAGSHHSLLLADGIGFQSVVYYCGKPYSDKVQQVQPMQPLRLTFLRSNAWVRKISAGGIQNGCVTDQNISGLVATLHEFAASDREFNHHLCVFKHTVLEKVSTSGNVDSPPKQGCDWLMENNLTKSLAGFEPLDKLVSHVKTALPYAFVNIESTNYGFTLKALFDSFLHLAHTVSVNCVELTHIIQDMGDISSILMFAHPEEYLSVFKLYCKSFSDAVAMNGLEYWIKCLGPLFEQCKEKLNEQIGDNKIKNKSSIEILQHFLKMPLLRVREYDRLISKLIMHFNEDPDKYKTLKEIGSHWEVLKNSINSELQAAEQTKAFWDICPPKSAENFKTPNRRIILDSKKNPLNIFNSGRFSSHWFLLFNDAFIHIQFSTYQRYSLLALWVEPLQDNDILQNALLITTPEDVFTVCTPTSQGKTEWLCALNQAINKEIANQSRSRKSVNYHLIPPLVRHAKHVFTKSLLYKDAKYEGMFLCGKLQGHGTMLWPDGRKYCGKFKQGLQHGKGIYVSPTPDGDMIYEGNWKDGKLHGLGNIRYPNSDVYEGYFKDGQCHGHGIFKQGNFLSTAASIYIGEWTGDQRNGYGVMDDILAGEKYMGMWQDNCRHGNGLVVTLDGVYYEGTFHQNKMTGCGLMMFEDDACYEGEFAGGGLFGGKGVLRLPNGDKIEGNFNGRWSEGVKINGTFLKSAGTVNERKVLGPNFHSTGFVPSSFGQLCVSADMKWNDIFNHCLEMLGYQGTRTNADTEKAWEYVAIMVSSGKKKLMFAEKNKMKGHKMGRLDGLERIPSPSKGTLTYENFKDIQAYLVKAFDTSFHPLGKLMEGLVDVYRATYVGVGAHPRLLHHAVQEVRSFVKRIYSIVRILFPDLPSEGCELVVTKGKDNPSSSYSDSEEEEEYEVITSSGLILPILLPQIYPPLFTLYALYNEKEDDWYWERLTKWNKQSDIALMTYLGMDQKFWMNDFGKNNNSVNVINIKDQKDHYFSDAVETLQHLSTTFSPSEKLNVIRKSFEEVNKVVQTILGDFIWSMDDLFPVFQFVVVRSRIRHLGSEIHLIDDLMESHLQNGEFGIMFTTLKACYFQIQNEKMINT